MKSTTLIQECHLLIEWSRSTKAYCYGKYRDVDPDNVLCVEYLQQVQECVEKINMPQILEPLCGTLSPKPHFLKWDRNALVEEIPKNLSLPTIPGPWCRLFMFESMVFIHLGDFQGTKEEWQRCNKTLSMTNDVVNSDNFHKNLTTKRCRVLVYSVSGFTERYTNNLYSLTFATVKDILEENQFLFPHSIYQFNMQTIQGQHCLKSQFHITHGNIHSTASCKLVLLVWLSLCSVVLSHIVKTLPGYKGDLPFKLENGKEDSDLVSFLGFLRYVNVSVGKSDAVNLFYYFIESEGNPREDPLMLWLTGGPGCSGFSGLVYEIEVANIIFLDAPVGTGFSYANNWESYVLDDQLSATEIYNFLMIWLMDHPQFLSNDLYIYGDSYSGLIVPNIVQKIYVGNLEVGVEPLIKLKNGLYESTKTNCHGEYLDVDPNNAPCIKGLQLVTNCLYNIENPLHFLLPPSQDRKLWCRVYNYVLSDIWANDERVQKALHIRKGSIEKWVRCNNTLSYNEDLLTSIEYHRNLSHTDLRALIYSGDHDMAIPYVGTHKWIDSLALPIDEDWRPWFVDGQVGGEQVTQLQNISLENVFVCFKGNEGYLLGNPFTHEINDLNSRVPFAHRVSTKAYCYGKYRDVDPDNVLCVEYLQQVQECVEKINMPQILEPLCGTLSPKPHFLKWDRNALVEEIPKNLSLPTIPGPWCRLFMFESMVFIHLGDFQGTKEEWQRCNKTLSMTNDVVNSDNFHRNLTTKRCRVLVYRFTERYTNNLYSLTFATVKDIYVAL
ncbi:unnamed protein product [Camellia sinensis]